MKTAKLALVAVLSIALLAPASAAAAERLVSVTATATLRVPNDTAKVGVGVSRERRTRGDALRAASAALAKVIAAAQKVPGVGDGDVETGRIDVNKTYRGEVPIYRASEGASITLHEPKNAGKLIQTAIGAGATGFNGPSYSIGNTEAAFGRVLAAAFDRARAKAAVLAGEAGATLGQAVLVEEGEGAELLPFAAAKDTGSAGACAAPAPTTGSTDVTKSDAYVCAAPTPPPTKPGVSKVKATVHVVFELR